MAPVVWSGWRAHQDGRTLAEGKEPKTGRVYTMFHGTHVQNARDIVINGFHPSSDGLLGKGVYVSRNIAKAKCYPLRTDKKYQVVFKLKVNVGKVKMINCDNHPLQKSWHDDGYDSAWVPPNSNVSVIKSGREEDCVWDPSRITVVSVAFCGDEDKLKELRRLIRSHVRPGDCQCRQKTSGVSHDIQGCWECGDRICPFEREHVCKP